jgi:hypothetical protein
MRAKKVGRTMKKSIACAAIGLILFGMVGVATAAMAEMQWTDVWKPPGGQEAVCFHCDPHGYSSFSYQHNLIDDGFNPEQDIIDAYTLRIGLSDDSNNDRSEWALIDLPGVISDSLVEVDFGDIMIGSSLLGQYRLNKYGMLDVIIHQVRGDFRLTGSELIADGWTSDAAVPIPASVLLLASGMAGLIVLQRTIAA